MPMLTSLKPKILVALRVLLGIAFVAAAAMKLTGQSQMVAEFDTVGLGQWFRYATGLIELVGALLLVRRSTVVAGATLLLCVSIGAFFAQLLRLHGDVIHTIVFALLLAWVAYAYRRARPLA